MRAALVFQLKEALHDQEPKLDLFCTVAIVMFPLKYKPNSQLPKLASFTGSNSLRISFAMVARDQIKLASDMRRRLTLQSVPGLPIASIAPVMETTRAEPIFPSIQPTSTPPTQPPLNQPISFASLKTTEEENKKAAAAAVAAKLAASASSAQMLTSVLSSLVAEEAASMNSSLNSCGFSAGLSIFPPEKRPKLEKPMAISDVSNSDVGNSPYYSPLQQQPVTNMPVASSTTMQPMSQLNQIQSPFAPAPPPLPPPPLSPANPPVSQYIQSSGMMVGVMPYGYGANTLPPPPPLPPHIAVGLARPASQSPQQPQPQQQQQQATGGYYRPPGIGFYGQSQPSTPPVPRQ
ncbi:hypothetical protein EZV62_028293 [Acer yangbiense]|uniref:Uncharacterized protein n=1 Tax=Acer yangbiense TaxID=1000413 RepID=A0A5C7GPT1_9ROSI|nr:hypothetical protein EZV62_028293 [Acer yangbiense]